MATGSKTIPLPEVECHDCWGEALLTVGIYETTTRIPNHKRKALIEAYDGWLYRSHELGDMAMVR